MHSGSARPAMLYRSQKLNRRSQIRLTQASVQPDDQTISDNHIRNTDVEPLKDFDLLLKEEKTE